MSEHTAVESDGQGGSSAGAKRHGVALVVLLLIAASISLLLHGIAWWYVPLAAGLLITAHIGVPLLVIYLAGRQRMGNSSSRGRILRLPHFYDLLARVVTMGREKQFRRWSLELASLQPGMSLLDLGCGTGSLLIEASDSIGEKGRGIGFDPSEEMIHRAREKATDSAGSLQFEVGYADRIECPDQSIDVLFSTLVFHHLPVNQHKTVVAEMARVLKPGGRMVIVDWQKPTSILRAMAYPMFLIYVLHQAGPAQSPLDTPGLRQALEDNGFVVRRTSYGKDGVVGALVADLHSSGSD